jgi:hypothetical protein
VASTAADFSFSRASGFAFFEERSDEFPAARALKKLSITQTSRARAARCRDAPAARTVSPRARNAQGPLELPPGESVRTIRNVGLLAGIGTARSVMPPGTAARVPTKQDRAARLPLNR